MEEKRKVIIYKWKWSDKEEKNIKVEQNRGDFQQYGYENDGDGSYSTAIVQLDDGTVRNVHVEMIKFIKITTKDGLLYLNGVEVQLPAADRLAEENNFACAEHFVKYLEFKKEQK